MFTGAYRFEFLAYGEMAAFSTGVYRCLQVFTGAYRFGNLAYGEMAAFSTGVYGCLQVVTGWGRASWAIR